MQQLRPGRQEAPHPQHPLLRIPRRQRSSTDIECQHSRASCVPWAARISAARDARTSIHALCMPAPSTSTTNAIMADKHTYTYILVRAHTRMHAHALVTSPCTGQHRRTCTLAPTYTHAYVHAHEHEHAHAHAHLPAEFPDVLHTQPGLQLPGLSNGGCEMRVGSCMRCTLSWKP